MKILNGLAVQRDKCNHMKLYLLPYVELKNGLTYKQTQ